MTTQRTEAKKKIEEIHEHHVKKKGHEMYQILMKHIT